MNTIYTVEEVKICPDCSGAGLCKGECFSALCLTCAATGKIKRRINLIDALAYLGVALRPDPPSDPAQSIAGIKKIRESYANAHTIEQEDL
jgi:hypothetical protein